MSNEEIYAGITQLSLTPEQEDAVAQALDAAYKAGWAAHKTYDEERRWANERQELIARGIDVDAGQTLFTTLFK